MRFRKRKPNSRNTSGFDVTPLVDVMFLLQIFFLLTLGSSLNISEVSLPGSNSGTALAKEAITVTVSSKGLSINGRSSKEGDLEKLPPDKDIVILAAKDIPYVKVVSALDTLRSSGHGRVCLATKPLKD